MPRRHRLLPAAATLGAVLFAAACATAPTALPAKPGLPLASAGSMQAHAVIVVADPHGAAAQLTGALVNTSRTTADELTAVTIGGIAAPLAQPVRIGPGQVVSLTPPGGPRLVAAPATGLRPGRTTTVVLDFTVAGHLTVATAVQDDTGPYSVFHPAAPATTEPSP